jgi:phage/plasmid-like protein (TIGR03299 family)
MICPAGAGRYAFSFPKDFHMHLVQTMAYTGQQPWHGLGNPLGPNQPIEVWAERAGMNWHIESAEVRYVAAPSAPSGMSGSSNPSASSGIGAIHAFPEQKVLYRSDTKAPLSVVSSRYQVVQPAEILEFYRDLTEVGGFELETAGVLREGRKLWALARTGQSGC